MKQHIVRQVKNYPGIFKEWPKCVPTNGEPDGPLCGNGDVGIVMGEGVKGLRFYYSKNDMWCAKPHHLGGGMKSIGFLEITSESLEQGSFEAVQEIDTAHIKSKVIKGDYGLATDTYVYAHDHLVITKVKCIGKDIKLEIKWQMNQEEGASCTLEKLGNTLEGVKMYKNKSVEWETKVCVKTIVLNQPGTSMHLKEQEEVTIVSSIVTNHDTPNYREICQQKIMGIDEEQLESYASKHNEWWENFWEESGIGIPSELEIEKFWYGSHYIMACCSRNKNYPPGIFGNWITTDTPNWGADYHLNYNHEAPWWGVYSSNKVKLADPYDTPILEAMPGAQRAAQKKLNCRGVYYKVGVGPKGLETARMFNVDGTENEEAPYWGQKSNAAYAAVNMLMRYYSTYDEEYAKEIVYPYLREVALFWEDYLRFEEGRYVIYNDCIHENWAAFSDDPNAPDYSDDFNPLLTLGLLRVVFKGLLEISRELDIDEKKREKWQHILEHLSEFPTQIREGKQVFRYTERGMDWNEGNSLGIQHIFPCGTIGLGSDKKLLEIGINTLEALNRWEDYNAFPTFFTAAARLGYNPDIILEHMKAEFRKHAFNNFFVYYGGGGIECCSTVPSCINEMLLQSHEGVIRVFPVWNRTKDAQFYKLRAYGAFVISAALINGEIQEIELFSEKGRKCCVEMPWLADKVFVYKIINGRRYEINKQRQGNTIQFNTDNETLYIISNREQMS